MRKETEVIRTDITNIKKALSKNIKFYRKLRKISQQGLADMCGLHRTYISDLENSKCNPTLEVMMIIANNLQVTLAELLDTE